MAEKEKRKGKSLNRQDSRGQRDFAKRAKKFPYLHREFELLQNGWKSREPFKNLRLLRNFLALLLALLVGLRYQLGGIAIAVILLIIAIAIISIVLIFDKLSKTEKNTNRRLNNSYDKGFISAAIYGCIAWFTIIIFYLVALQNLIFPNTLYDSSTPVQANLFMLFCFPISPFLAIFAMMGFWHILQLLWVAFEPRPPKIKNED